MGDGIEAQASSEEKQPAQDEALEQINRVDESECRKDREERRADASVGEKTGETKGPMRKSVQERPQELDATISEGVAKT